MTLNIVEKSKEKYILYEKRHQKILDTAIRIFSQKGYKATTTAVIAKESSISEPTLYKHFKNKKKLFLACFQSIIDQLNNEYLKFRDDFIDDEMGYLGKMANIYLDFVVNKPDKSMFLVHILSYSGDKEFDSEYRTSMGKQVELLKELISAAKKKGKIKSHISSQLLAGFLICQYFTVVSVRKFVDPRELTTENFFHLMECLIESK